MQTVAGLLDDYRLGTWRMNPDDVLLQFIALYDAWDQPEKADEYLRERAKNIRPGNAPGK